MPFVFGGDAFFHRRTNKTATLNVSILYIVGYILVMQQLVALRTMRNVLTQRTQRKTLRCVRCVVKETATKSRANNLDIFVF